ncbi:MAG: hypothetical protein ACO1N0_03590 [Fluviicola sp.]
MDKIQLKSYQPILLNSADELLAYTNLWKAVCKKGIEYRDIFSGPLTAPIAEGKLKDNEAFRLYRQEAKNRDFELHDSELVLVKALHNRDPEVYSSYLKLHKETAKLLLHFAKKATDTTDKTNQYVEEIRKLAKSYPEADSFYKLLVEHELIEEQQAKTEAFRRHFLYQKNEFVSAARELYLKHTEILEDPKSSQFKELRNLLLSDNDLDYHSLEAIFPALEKTDKGNVPVLKNTKTDYKAEYWKLQYELENLDKTLKAKTLEMRSGIKGTERQKIFTEIGKLREQKEMLTYVSEQHCKKSGILNRMGASTRNWMSENLLDKKKAGKDALKVFLSTTGVTVGKTLFYFAMNQTEKIDPDKVQKEIINGLIETGLTAVGTFFFGPLGGSFTKSIMPFFRDEPADPYLEEFSAIKKQLSEGFEKLTTKLDAIGTQITNELNAVVNKLLVYQDLSARHSEFLRQKDTVLSLMKKLEQIYQRIYFERKTSIKEQLTQLLEWDSNMQQELIRLVSIFYHDDFNLNNELTEPSENSVCGLFMTYNTEKSVSFHETTRKLLNTCHGLEKLGEAYLQMREKWFASLGAYLLFFKEDISESQEIFQIYWNAFRDKNTFNIDLTLEMEMLKTTIIGSRNIALLRRIERALDPQNKRIDFLGGFGLETQPEKPGDTPLLYDYEFENLYTHKGTFKTRKQRHFISRYVIVNYTLESQSKSYYTTYTHQENEIPVPIHLHLRLLRNDNLGIFNYGNDTYYPMRVVNPDDALEFENTIEGFFGAEKAAVNDTNLTKRFYLPVKNLFIEVFIGYPYEVARMQIFYSNQSSSTNRISTYDFPLKFSTKSELGLNTQKIRTEIRPKADHRQAAIEIIVDRKSDKMQGIATIVLSDYEVMRKAGLSRGLEGVSTYCLTMTQEVKGTYREVPVRTENLRPFTTNLLLGGDQFLFAGEEHDHLPQAVNNHTGWRSYNNLQVLKINASNRSLYLQLYVHDDYFNHDNGSVFSSYNHTNHYGGSIIFQRDGNLVMYDSDETPITATGTNSSDFYTKFAFIGNDHYVHIVDPRNKDSKKFWTLEPEVSQKTVNKRRVSNQLLNGTHTKGGYDNRLESENGLYYLELRGEETDSGSSLFGKKYRYVLDLKTKNGQPIETVLSSKALSKAEWEDATYELYMQKDGNLVAYATRIKGGRYPVKEEKAVFALGTNSKEYEGCVLFLSNDGRVFLVNPGERKITKWIY